MLKTRIIPCLDVKDGRTVKGVNFEDLRDAGDPVELARRYDLEAADELCFLDIAASLENRGTMLDLVSRTAGSCFMPLTVGGGVSGPEDMIGLLRAGADKVAINTAAVRDPELLRDCAAAVGRQCVVMAIDAKRDGRGWRVHTHGGSRPSAHDAVALSARAEELGAGEILLTSMDRDGVGTGYDIALVRAVCDAVSIPVIASGGAGSAEDLVPPVRDGGASAVLAASIFHYRRASIADARAALAAAGVPVRPVSNGRGADEEHRGR